MLEGAPVCAQNVFPMRFVNESGWARFNRAVISGRIIPYLVFVMFVVAGTGTAAVELLSPNSFDSLGDAAWWAATTVTTIGYGDVVPGTSGGRVIAVFVMFASVATVSFTTAVVTAAFVTHARCKYGPADARRDGIGPSGDGEAP